jgi:hypothetical protein
MATGIERLHFMVGEWDIQAYNMDETGNWQESPLPKYTKIESVFDGAFLQEQEVKMQVANVVTRFFIMWSYDKFRQVYRMLACDDQDGLADILEGNFEANTDTIIVSNINSGTAMQDGNGNKAFLRLTSTQTSEHSFTDEMHESYDGGHSWSAVYRAVHSRVL